MTYTSEKTWGHDVGLSCCFRQWRAPSHCRFLHGYALSVTVEFSAERLDECGWVVDFGGLKGFKAWLQEVFDHKLLIAADDPDLPWFEEANRRGLCELVVLEDGVGCERFAELIAKRAQEWVNEAGLAPRVWVSAVRVREHGANGAGNS